MEQEKILWRLIADTIKDANEGKKQFWIKRMTGYFSKRLRAVPKTDWIVFLSQMSDRQACGRYTEPKHQKYCIMIRDAARRKEKHDEARDQTGNGALCNVY